MPGVLLPIGRPYHFLHFQKKRWRHGKVKEQIKRHRASRWLRIQSIIQLLSLSCENIAYPGTSEQKEKKQAFVDEVGGREKQY